MSLSPDDSFDAPETVSTLGFEKVTGSHLFKIMGYSLHKDIGINEYLESATFEVGGYDWSIGYYLNGDIKSKYDQAPIFVCFKSKTEIVRAQACFMIVNENGDQLSDGIITDVRKHQIKNQGFGLPDFVKRSEVESFLKDDCLLIRCIVTVFKAVPVKIEPAFQILVPPPDTQQLSHLLVDGYGADVTFDVNEQTFNAHKCILAARSLVFRAQFFGPLKEKPDTIIKIEEMEAHVFKSLLHYIYSQTVPEFEERNESDKKHNTELAQHLLVAADRYDLERLKIICESILYGSIEAGNVVGLLSLAEMHNCIHLKTACLKFLASPEILRDVVASEQFQCLLNQSSYLFSRLTGCGPTGGPV
ncbi:BTB/POZ and MATH domain-containing protein 2 [Rhynchospora pubera]|uniref:BTB/POZ and MATH domain-containing protein 2 n=1 Tax=Rhynchospora pubera TaxID=906938 RepID=A0AAV8DLJ2_9POAL|nr:BTB/POZ and MATH domain-containing protein 2 [Rhynchospora pubera]